MTINANKESLLDIVQKIGMPKSLANAIIEAMGQKEFDYRSLYDIEAKRFKSDFAEKADFNNFFVFDKTLDFYDNNQADLIKFVQAYTKDNQYQSASHFIINVPFKETRQVETLDYKGIGADDADMMIKGNYLSEVTDWQVDHAQEFYNLYKNRMVMAATTILIDMHRQHFAENLLQAHEISQSLNDLSGFVLKPPFEGIADFHFLGGFMAFNGRIIPAYSIGAMAESRALSKEYEAHDLLGLYTTFTSALLDLREEDDDYGFMGVEDENDLFITTTDLPHFLDGAAISNDVVFRQLAAANGSNLDILVNDTDYRVRETIAEFGSGEAKEYLKNDDNEKVIKALISHNTEDFAIQFVNSEVVEYRIAAAHRLREDLLISTGFINDKNPLVRIATMRPYHKKILDILSNDSDGAVRKAAEEAKAEKSFSSGSTVLDDFFF